MAVPALIAYNYFLSKVNFFTKDLEYLAQELISAKIELAKKPVAQPKPQPLPETETEFFEVVK